MAEPNNSENFESEDAASADLSSRPPISAKTPVEASNMMLGEFRLLRKLGKGGMAEVYLAEQTTLRRQVAVKILRPEFITTENYVKRFRHEAAAAGSLNHPNIVQVYMVGEQNGVNYIAQEYVQGRTLRDYLRRKGPMEIKLALHILRQVASALQVASENGIVHRDIKPENILLTNKGEAKVADFGLAQLTLQGERVSLTQTGMTMGTPLYMSPEQVNGLPLDSRSDIYSFGIMAYHMLAGRPPFSGDTAMAVAVKHLNEKPPLISEFRVDLPPPVMEFVKRLIQKKKDDRPADFATIVAEIKQLQRLITGKPEPTTVIPSKPRRMLLIDRPFHSQIPWVILACVLVMSATAGIGWTMRTPEILKTVSAGASTVRVMPTADGQLYLAVTDPQNESNWVEVKQHADSTEEMKARAQAALGLIYLKTNRRPLAENVFNELRNSANYKSDGLAGLALLSGLKNELDAARKLIAQVDDLNSRLFPEIEGPYKDLVARLNPSK